MGQSVSFPVYGMQNAGRRLSMRSDLVCVKRQTFSRQVVRYVVGTAGDATVISLDADVGEGGEATGIDRRWIDDRTVNCGCYAVEMMRVLVG